MVAVRATDAVGCSQGLSAAEEAFVVPFFCRKYQLWGQRFTFPQLPPQAAHPAVFFAGQIGHA